jgi:hypothetical protein
MKAERIGALSKCCPIIKPGKDCQNLKILVLSGRVPSSRTNSQLPCSTFGRKGYATDIPEKAKLALG